MKKIILSLFILLSIAFSSCGVDARFEDFDTYRTDFDAVAEAARAHYSAADVYDEHLILELDEYSSWADESLSDAVENVEASGFDYIWIEDAYLIIWSDETHTYGVLYTPEFSSAMEEIREDWYSTIEYAKLGGDWYEIGQLTAI